MTLPSTFIEEVRAIDGLRVRVEASLAPLTSVGTGGKADLLVTAANSEALVQMLRLLGERDVPWVCLGAGTDLLVADEGYRGVVVKLGPAFEYITFLPVASHSDGKVAVSAGAATLLARLAASAAESGLAGLEFASGIPGSVGGAVATNAGAYGSFLGEIVEEVEIATALGVRWVQSVDLEWDYRCCPLPPHSVVTAVRFCLAPQEPATVLERHRSILEQRRKTQPRGVRTFGCAFKNPTGGGAGRLIDAAGLKGVRVGGAEISSVHANFLVNLGDATTADMLSLMSLMRQEVKRTTNVSLEPEVRLLGTSFPWEAAGADPQESC